MNGQPVWLASLSRRDVRGRLVATGDWSADELSNATLDLHRVLKGVGDKSRERCFRMNVTLCLHRAATDEEIAGLPASWHADLTGLAGGPVEVLWEKGVKAGPSAYPCHNPIRRVVSPERADLWIPEDCGACPPCQARQAIVSKGDDTI